MRKNRTPALPLPYMIDIKKAGGYYIWRDEVILENCKCTQAPEMRKVKHRIAVNTKNNLKTTI